ncbi:MAG TPA: hypothetical protein VFS67_00075 [Polyangiaceae bacterium]|nr:hypothetical protein [Polyangiaceae bacterium]
MRLAEVAVRLWYCGLLLCASCAVDDRAPATVNGGSAGAADEGASAGGTPGASDVAGASGAGGAAGAGAGGAGAGGAGVGGAAGGSGAAGSAAGGAGGTSQVIGAGDAPCRGCVELVMPVTEAEQSAQFQFQFAAPGLDFSAGTVQWRVQVLQADTNPNFFLTTDVQNGPSNSYAGVFANYSVLSTYNFPPAQWLDLAIDVSAHPPPQTGPGFNYRAVEWVSLTVGTTEAFEGTGTVRVLIDSVTFTGVSGATSTDFRTGLDGFMLNAFDAPEGTQPPILHPL